MGDRIVVNAPGFVTSPHAFRVAEPIPTDEKTERRLQLIREIADRLPFLSTEQLEEMNRYRMPDDGDDC